MPKFVKSNLILMLWIASPYKKDAANIIYILHEAYQVF